MNAGYVYVLAFDNGMVKVGQTKNTRTRLNAHRQSARNFGLTITGKWESPLHVGWLENEHELKRLAAELGGEPTTPEYFSGVSFDALTEKARELPFEPPAPLPAIRDAAPDPRSVAARASAASIRFLALQPLLTDSHSWKVQAAAMFLDGGITPDVMRHSMKRPKVADYMEAIASEEAKIRLDRARSA